MGNLKVESTGIIHSAQWSRERVCYKSKFFNVAYLASVLSHTYLFIILWFSLMTFLICGLSISDLPAPKTEYMPIVYNLPNRHWLAIFTKTRLWTQYVWIDSCTWQTNSIYLRTSRKQEEERVIYNTWEFSLRSKILLLIRLTKALQDLKCYVWEKIKSCKIENVTFERKSRSCHTGILHSVTIWQMTMNTCNVFNWWIQLNFITGFVL